MEQIDLLRRLIAVLEAQGIPYFLVGSIASGVFGEPRMTRDIDVVVDLTPGDVDRLCAEFPAPEFYVSLPAAQTAAAKGGQFNVIHPASGNKIDFMILRHDAWGKSQLARRTKVPILVELPGYLASPEDIILSKLHYYQIGESEKHLRDITGMLQLLKDRVDVAYLQEWTLRLGLLAEWEMVKQRLKP